MIFHISWLSDISLLSLRGIVAVVYLSGGWKDIVQPGKRSESIEMPLLFTFGLGLWEVVGALSILFGIFIQIGALMLMLVMCGALYKEIFVWHKKFFEGQYGGWHYDLLFFILNFVIFATGGGRLVMLGK